MAGVGISGSVLGEVRARSFANWACVFWVGQIAFVNGPYEPRRDDKMAFVYSDMPLGFIAAAWLAPVMVKVARNSRLLDSALGQRGAEARALERYRTELTGALRVVRDALQEASRALATVGGEDQGTARDLLQRAVGRLDERVSVLDVAGARPSSVQELVYARIAALRWLAGRDAHLRADVAPAVRVTDSRVLALIGATVSTGVTNALRHASNAKNISITVGLLAPGQLLLEVRDDGARPAAEVHPVDLGHGLRHLKRQAHALQGELTAGYDEHGWRCRLKLPTTPPVPFGGDLVSARMIEEVDRKLLICVRLCAVMVFIKCVRSEQLVGDHVDRSRVLNIAIVAVYEVLERAGLWALRDPPRPQPAQNVARIVFAAAALVSAASPHREHEMLSGWTGAALARHGLRSSRAELLVLFAANAAGIFISYRGDWRQGVIMTAHEVANLALGPTLVAFAITRARESLETRERQLDRTLRELEQLNDLAESFHSAHPCTTPMETLQTYVKHHPDADAALDRARAALAEASMALPKPPSGTRFAEQFAQTLAARIWPVVIELYGERETLRQVPRTALAATEFRQRAARIAEIVGEQLLDAFPPDWAARPSLRTVKLIMSANPVTKTVHCEVVPDLTTRQRLRPAAQLAHSLARLGGTLQEGHGDGRIAFDLYPQRYLEQEA